MFTIKSLLIAAISKIGCVIALSACMVEQSSSPLDHSQLAFEPPPGLRQSNAIDVYALYVEISINDTLVQTIRNGGHQQWLATVLLPMNTASVISVAWYQQWQCTELLLATATQTVSATSEAISIDFQDGYDFNYDSNGNGTNNFDELNNGTSPANCASDSDTTSITPTTPGATDTPTTPEALDTPTAPIFPEMISVPAGCFNMGSPADEADRDASREMQHNVCVSAFSIGKYEITLTEYDRYTNANDLDAIRALDDIRDGYPIRNVTWVDANAYASWLGSQDGNTYRLPTEEEWEYATRAGSTTAFNTGNTITTDQARFAANGGPSKVGSFAPNAFGLYDTHGNVLEMTCSEFSADYATANACITNVAGVETVVARGGAHNYAKSIQLRSAARRGSISPNEVKSSTGFRLVKE